MSLLVAILTALCALLGWRLLAARRLARGLAAAAARAEPLLAAPGGAGRELVDAVNGLIAQVAAARGTGLEYHEQIQALLGNLREAVAMVDRDGLILSANPAFGELVGAAGRRLDACVQGSGFVQFLREARQGVTAKRQEIEVEIGQQQHWLEVSAAPLAGQAGGAGRYTLFIFHNITRQKRLERMRTEFVANVSHELRTPVTVIKGFAETLIDDEAVLGPEEKRRFLQKIRSNAERLHSLLQDLLLLSRLESAGMVLERERVHLPEFLGELSDNWRPQLEDSGKHLVLDMGAGAVHVEADPLRLSQVFNNLIDNVLRHATGFTEIRLRVRREERGMVLTVEDNGAGIPEKDLPHIFQRFYRVDKGRSRESGGTGLGLSIVKHIVVQHGGEIQARSRRGEGTVIEILLPLNGPPAKPSGVGAHGGQ